MVTFIFLALVAGAAIVEALRFTRRRAAGKNTALDHYRSVPRNQKLAGALLGVWVVALTSTVMFALTGSSGTSDDSTPFLVEIAFALSFLALVFFFGDRSGEHVLDTFLGEHGNPNATRRVVLITAGVSVVALVLGTPGLAVALVLSVISIAGVRRTRLVRGAEGQPTTDLSVRGRTANIISIWILTVAVMNLLLNLVP